MHLLLILCALVGELAEEFEAPGVVLYASFDRDDIALSRFFSVWNLSRHFLREAHPQIVRGVAGGSASIDTAPLLYPCTGLVKGNWMLASFVKLTGDPPQRPLFKGISAEPLSADSFKALRDGKWHLLAYQRTSEGKAFRFLDARKSRLVSLPPAISAISVPRMEILLDELVLWRGSPKDEVATSALQCAQRGEKPWGEVPSELKPPLWSPEIFDRSDHRAEEILARFSKPESSTRGRERYVLGGKWRFQPSGPARLVSPRGRKHEFIEFGFYDPEGWMLVNIPHRWRVPKESPPQSHSAPWQIYAGSYIAEYPCAWYEKDFYCPESWKNRSVYLLVERIEGGCSVYLNKKYAGELTAGQPLNLTSFIRFGGLNRLAVLNGKPHRPPHSAGLLGEVLIETRKTREFDLRGVFAMPSIRKKKIGLELVFYCSKSKSLSLEATVRNLSDGTVAKVLRYEPLRLGGGNLLTKRIYMDWEDPILWTPETPHLYTLSVALLEKGKFVDESFPIIFGFREIWIEDGNIMFNGVKLRFRGRSHNFLKYPFTIEKINEARRVGGNCDRTASPRLENLWSLDLTDRVGWLVHYNVPRPADTDDPAYWEWYRTALDRVRNHPSVVLWQIWRYSYNPGPHGHPLSIGAILTDKDLQNPRYIREHRAVERLKAIDPTRPAYYYQLGVSGDIRSIMHYLGYGTPLQSREEWPRYWAKTRPAPFMAVETSLALLCYGYRWQDGLRRLKGGGIIDEPLFIEHSARYFGDDAYRDAYEELVNSINLTPEKRAGYWPYKSPSYYRLKAIFALRCLRSWRTYGISYLLHTDLRAGYREGKITEFGKALQRSNMPLLVYIGGYPDFVRKDHSFYSGEEVGKQVVVVNDHFSDVTLEGRWSVKGTGLAGEVKLSIPAGEIAFKHFSFKAPPVRARMPTAILLDVSASTGERIRDEFPIEIFPPPEKPTAPPLALYDTTGDTARLLKKAGLDFLQVKESIPQSAEALVIGRKSWDPGELKKLGLEKFLKRGGKLLVMEQTNRWVMGLKVDDPNVRRAFICADSALLAGLDNRDFHDWRGFSDIIEPYPSLEDDYGFMDKHRARGFFGENEWAHWSTNGTLSAFYFYKPLVGNYSILLSSGFDMLYTPLVILYGDGEVALCQLDVTNRFGIDPVATLLTKRLLKWLGERAAGFAPADFFGDKYWAGVLQSLSAEINALSKPEPRSKVLIIGIGKRTRRVRVEKKPEQPGITEATEKEEDELLAELVEVAPAEEAKPLPPTVRALASARQKLARFVREGGTLLLLDVEDISHLDWLPVKVQVERRKIFRSDPVPLRKAPLNILSGVSGGELFWREVLELPLLSSPEKRSVFLDSGLVGVVPYGEGRFVFCQLYPDLFTGSWQRAKTLRVLSLLLTNLGVKSSVRLSPFAEKDASPYYPIQTLDINPDRHRIW